MPRHHAAGPHYWPDGQVAQWLVSGLANIGEMMGARNVRAELISRRFGHRVGRLIVAFASLFRPTPS